MLVITDGGEAGIVLASGNSSGRGCCDGDNAERWRFYWRC